MLFVYEQQLMVLHIYTKFVKIWMQNSHVKIWKTYETIQQTSKIIQKFNFFEDFLEV